MSYKQKTGLLFILIFFFFSGASHAKKLAALPDILKPLRLTIDTDRFYVTEGTTIYIYSLKDFKLMKKFGKSGEGPQEFNGNLPIQIIPKADDLMINSFGKISFYSKDGIYQRELKTSSISLFFRPLGKQFVGYGILQEDKITYMTINFFDGTLKKGNEIYRRKRFIQQSGDINPLATSGPLFYISDNKIFVDGEDGVILCFDNTGKKVLSIDPKIKKRKVTEEDVERYRNFFKNDSRIRDAYENLKHRIKFPDYFPPIQFYMVADKKIYIVTYQKEGENSECIVFDTQGKLLKKTMVPLFYATAIEPYPADIKNGKLYQLVENEDEEKWELHVTPII
jgi:hypothetical protein